MLKTYFVLVMEKIYWCDVALEGGDA